MSKDTFANKTAKSPKKIKVTKKIPFLFLQREK